MLAGGGLIWHVMKACHSFFENFMLELKYQLEDGLSKLLLIKIKDLTLCSKLVGSELIWHVMKTCPYFIENMSMSWSTVYPNCF